MGSFQDFCNLTATPIDINISTPTDPNVVEIPFGLEDDINWLVSEIKPKLSRLDKIHIGYIEHVFDDMNLINDIMKDAYAYDIDEGIPYALTRYLYDTTFDKLECACKNIIKVLSVYILVQKYIK